MSLLYIARRFGVLLVIIWLAATLNFFLPRLSGDDPVRNKLLEQASLGGYAQAGIEDMVKVYQKQFGLDRPLYEQYLTYIENVAHGDLNYSIANYPRTVVAMIGEALPWTIGLLGLTTVISFALGTFLGALLAWPGAPRWLQWVMPPLWALHAIPFFLLGLVLMWLLAFQAQILPIFGGYSPGAKPGWTPGFILDVLRHAVLPSLSIILVSVGGWALAMRGMMVTTMGEDYVTFAEAKGLRSLSIFTRYCMRNAILPQTTALALALGQILSGAVLVEVIFGYPGLGALLFQAIQENDFFLIQGIVFTVIVGLGFATFLLDILYPWLDPRISYRRG
ncbi:ABC transporter permease [Rhodopila sp.]|jgi:peptide/nickel transport system permease protein|uniref:ABC transporter permease n=1 Tax=Rhodopila sp. TaxID=2480087 RepID=UPI002C734BEB|nr:ABC transporter permease [Rhodopila sp.]HVZ08180.1 ABC transporter permease [Rhodopila sp.]